jgi:hypothetical protein
MINLEKQVEVRGKHVFIDVVPRLYTGGSNLESYHMPPKVKFDFNYSSLGLSAVGDR